MNWRELVPGFCLAVPVGSVVAMTSMISTQAMSGLPILFPLYFGGGWFVLYAGCGGFPYLLAGAPKRNVVTAFWGFGIGGAAAGK